MTGRAGIVLFAGLTAIVASSFAACPSDEQVDVYLQDFAQARLSKGLGNDLTREEAECAQAKLIKKLPNVLGRVVGYKAAFTNPAVQQRFGISSPAWGVMFEKMLVQSGAKLPMNFAARPIFEADLIAVVKDPALAEARTPLEALRCIEAIGAFLELPDLMLEGEGLPSGTAHIATNVGFRSGVLGPRVKAEATQEFLDKLANMTVVLTEGRSSKELGRAPGKAILDNPVNSAMWLAQALKKAGIDLKPGDLLSLGGFIPPSPVQSYTIITVKYVGLPGDPAVTVRFD